jgi:hypothetical protein
MSHPNSIFIAQIYTHLVLNFSLLNGCLFRALRSAPLVRLDCMEQIMVVFKDILNLMEWSLNDVDGANDKSDYNNIAHTPQAKKGIAIIFVTTPGTTRLFNVLILLLI